MENVTTISKNLSKVELVQSLIELKTGKLIEQNQSQQIFDFFEILALLDNQKISKSLSEFLLELKENIIYKISKQIPKCLNEIILKNILLKRKIDNSFKKPTNSFTIKDAIGPKLVYESQYRKLKKIQALHYKLKLTHKLFKSLLPANNSNLFEIDILNKISQQNHQSRRYLINYIKDSRSILVFDSRLKTINKILIENLPFAFYHDSQSIEIYEDLTGILVFISGGGSGSYSKEVLCYNITTKELTNFEKMSFKRGYAASIAHKNTLFIIGGSQSSAFGSKFIKEVEIFNIKTKTKINQILNINFPRSDPGIEILNNCLYVIGGVNFTQDPLEIEYLDLNYNQQNWIFKIHKVKLPRAFYGCVCITISSSLILFGGGENNQKVKSKELYTFDILKNKIEIFDNMLPEAGEYINVGCKTDKKCYFFDFHHSDPTKDYSLHELDLLSRNWKTYRYIDLLK